jgi:hypothetical protein
MKNGEIEKWRRMEDNIFERFESWYEDMIHAWDIVVLKNLRMGITKYLKKYVPEHWMDMGKIRS